MSSSPSQIITVDGASGSGKTTLLRGLGEHYDCMVVELGPIVRTASWLAERRHIPVVDAVAELVRLQNLRRLRIDRPAAGLLAASEIEMEGRVLRQEIFARSLNPVVRELSLSPESMAQVKMLLKASVIGRRAVVSGREAGEIFGSSAALQIRLEATAQVRRARKHAQLIGAGMRVSWMDDARLLTPREGSQLVYDTTAFDAASVLKQVRARIEHDLSWPRLCADEAALRVDGPHWLPLSLGA